MRLITLTDGTTMGDTLIVFRTNAPTEVLKELEKISCQVYIDGGEYEDVPIWAKVLSTKGYIFEYVNSHTHITAYGTSSDWLKKNYPDINEGYVIENQPNLA